MAKKETHIIQLGGEVLELVSRLADMKNQTISEFLGEAIIHEKWIRETLVMGKTIYVGKGTKIRAVEF